MGSPYRILLAEDHVLMREVVKKSLEEIPGLEVVGMVGDGLELLEAVESLTPHLVILDIGLPRMSGLEAAQQIKLTHPDIKILLLTMYNTKNHLLQAMELKIDGYLLKENAFKDLIIAIETIRAGNPYYSNLILQQMMEFVFKKREGPHEMVSPLTRREKEVLQCLAEGKSNREIAASLLISKSTARNHLINIKHKLVIKTNRHLLRYALDHGYLSLG
jgi:two-component system response regulator NreC